MMNTEATQKRMNRTRVEWLQFLTPFEYVLLDKMLFQSNLTGANGGDGFKFHVRTLARQTGISAGKVSETCRKWTFVRKSGVTKGMTIQLDYPAFERWIVHLMNNDCSPDEPISKSRNSTVPDGIVHPVNDDKSMVNEPSEARERACAQHSQAQHRHRSQIPIVHPVNNKRSGRFGVSEKGPLPLPLPARIKPGPSAARQSEIVRQLNAGGFSFVKDTAMGTERDGFKFCALDDKEKIVLITADGNDYLNNPKVQAMCRHFDEKKFDLMLWTESEQSIFKVCPKDA
ncbi:MAG: hypothetical protein IH623_32385 [Verrucomicrobia bacterium]|nr:hypothetical protein [Verrucomicrobiota bacterium]